MTKAWTEIAIKRKKFEGKRKTHTIPNTGGLSFSVREDGTYYEWRMMRFGESFKVHIGSVYEVSLEEAKNQAHQYRQNVKLGLPPQFDSFNQSTLSFQDAYDEYISSREFSDLKLSYRKTFIFRMEKYVVLTKNSTSAKDELRKAQVELKKNKLADVSLSSITEIVARQMWTKIKSAESANVAKAIKSHCKVIVDWNMEHNGVVLETNPFNFSVPRTNQKKREKLNTGVIAKLVLEPGQYTISRPDDPLAQIKTVTVNLKAGSTTTFIADFTQTVKLSGHEFVQSVRAIDGPVPDNFKTRTPVSMKSTLSDYISKVFAL